MVSGCQTANLIAPEYKVVKAPDYLYNCPVTNKFPVSGTLTDKQVGDLIIKLHQTNLSCKSSLDSLHKFYEDAENTINKK
jgi:hypothetical protein